jgi:hypothetical protein
MKTLNPYTASINDIHHAGQQHDDRLLYRYLDAEDSEPRTKSPFHVESDARPVEWKFGEDRSAVPMTPGGHVDVVAFIRSNR